METLKKTIPTSLQKLIDQLEKALNLETLTPAKVKQIVAEADLDINDLMVYADFDHPVEDCYGRKMVYDGGQFEVMVMSWNPMDYSSIHNHGYTSWGAVRAFGPAHHLIYCVKEGELRISARQILLPGEVVKVNNALIHQMGNPTSKPFLTLHVYGNQKLDGNITADAKGYELEFDRVIHTTGGAFFNLPEDNIYDFEPCPVPARDVFLHYANCLMDYYNRQKDCEKIQALKNNLLKKMAAVYN